MKPKIKIPKGFRKLRNGTPIVEGDKYHVTGNTFRVTQFRAGDLLSVKESTYIRRIAKKAKK